MNMKEILDNLWIEKYRPKKLDDVVLPDQYRQFFLNCISSKCIPNMLFYGGPGSGKSTVSRILIDEIIGNEKETRELDLLVINGSEKTGVEVVRNVILEFIKVPIVSDSKTKIVHIDEFDYMSQHSMAALRSMMEEYADRVRFIFTLNYINKIIDPIQSRCQKFEFSNNFSKEHVLNFIKNILKNESVEYGDDDIIKLYINKNFPDIRKIVNSIQTKVVNGELVSNIVKQNNEENEIVNKIYEIAGIISKENNLSKINFILKDIEKLLNENQDIEFMNLYNTLFHNESLSFSTKMIISKYCNSHQDVIIPQMHFISMIMELVETAMRKKACITSK